MPPELDRFPPPDESESDGPDKYSLQEMHSNRRWNIVVSAAILTGAWSACYYGVMSREQATWTTILTIIVAILYRWLFASKSSVKLDENAPGMGKKLHPRTMGGILGYLNDGFKNL